MRMLLWALSGALCFSVAMAEEPANPNRRQALPYLNTELVKLARTVETDCISALEKNLSFAEARLRRLQAIKKEAETKNAMDLARLLGELQTLLDTASELIEVHIALAACHLHARTIVDASDGRTSRDAHAQRVRRDELFYRFHEQIKEFIDKGVAVRNDLRRRTL